MSRAARKRKEHCHVQVTERLPGPARHPRHRSWHHGAGLAPGHGARPGHPVRRLRVHRVRPGGHAGVQQPLRWARVRAPAPRAGESRGRSGRPDLARAHSSRARADRRHLGVHRRRRGDQRCLRRRRAGRGAGAVHPRRAGVDRVRRGALLPPGRRRDHPGAPVRPVQPGLRRPDAHAGHRTAPGPQDHPLRLHGQGKDGGMKRSIVMEQDPQLQVQGGPEPVRDPHRSLHSETGARPGEHSGRSGNPLVKVAGLAWLEFEKPDLDRAERFYADFGLTVADRTPETLLLRGRWASTACLAVRRGPRPRFVGPAFQVAAHGDLDRLARGTGETVTAHWGGRGVLLRDPSGYPVRVIHGVPELAALPERAALPMNVGDFGQLGSGPVRANAAQRPARRAAQIQRLGHVVLGTTRFGAALDWYLDTLRLIVSDFLYLDGQRDRGPAMAFIRCDLGSVPADHHTLAMALQPRTEYVHSAYQLTDLDEVAASGVYLRERGYRHAWGLGRHIQGSQIFDYWRDPDKTMFEHYTDGDMFDCTMEPGWAPLSASGLAQWGPKATAEFTGTNDPRVVMAAIKALRDKGNEIDLHALRGLIKAMGS